MLPVSFAVIFDLDGVLVDSKEFHWAAWLRLASEVDFPITREGFLRTFGMPNKGVIEGYAGRVLDEQKLAFLAERKEEYYRHAIQGKIVGLPGAVELVRELKKLGVSIAVGSSAPGKNVDLVLDELGIRNCFGSVIKDGDYKNGKPAPDVFLTASSELGISPERCVVIEDAVPGVRAAKAAGMKCVAVTTTTTREALHEADLVVDSLKEALIKSILVNFRTTEDFENPHLVD